MPWSKLDIINLAFSKLNKNAVDDLANSGEFVNSASRVFDLLYPASISSKSWRFAVKIVRMSVLVGTPEIDRWTYILQLPSDYLSAVRTYPAMDYQIYENKMYANNNIVDLEYRFLPNPTALPAYFVAYFAVLIAAWYADSVAENEKLAERLEAEASIQLSDALFTDSQSHPTPAMRHNPVIQARGGYYQDYDRPPTS